MNKNELAEELRKRQINKADQLVAELNKEYKLEMTTTQFITTVKNLSNDDIILSYIICSQCNHSMIPPNEDVISLVKVSKNAEEWLSKLSCSG